MAPTWKEMFDWSEPRSIAELTSHRGARDAIPRTRGFYAFVEGKRRPTPDNCLYIGIAASRAGLYGRLGSYLRSEVSASHAAGISHRGKRLLSFARIRGIDGTGRGQRNSLRNDWSIFVTWAPAPLEFGALAASDREYAYMLERALIATYRPLYNSADWKGDTEIDLEDEAF